LEFLADPPPDTPNPLATKYMIFKPDGFLWGHSFQRIRLELQASP